MFYCCLFISVHPTRDGGSPAIFCKGVVGKTWLKIQRISHNTPKGVTSQNFST